METRTPSLMLDARRRDALARASRDWPSWSLTPRQLGDLELMLNGGYAPLDGFMRQADAAAVVQHGHLASGAPFPAPVVLEVSGACIADATTAGHLVLRDPEGVAVAVLEVAGTWAGSCGPDHPSTHTNFIGGPVAGLQLPPHHDFTSLRRTAFDVARLAREHGWVRTAAFATRRLIHRAGHEAIVGALRRVNGVVVMSLTDPGAPGDADRHLRVRAHQAVVAKHDERHAVLWLVPLPARRQPATDVLMQALVARNAACTHFIVTGDLQADALERLRAFAGEVGIEVLEVPASSAGPGGETIDAAHEAMMLARGERLPDWYTFGEVADELEARYPPRQSGGVTVFFTGLSGSGKSTIANVLRNKLLERGGRRVTMLDGDLVRQHLSSELGFSRRDRDINVRRIGFVASEITRHGGFAICAPIAPYESIRREVREAIAAVGGFVLVFVDTPLETCEARDRKGLYAKARAGVIAEFTGVSDAYETPSDAEIVIRTAEESPDAAADRILEYLDAHGYLAPRSR